MPIMATLTTGTCKRQVVAKANMTTSALTGISIKKGRSPPIRRPIKRQNQGMHRLRHPLRRARRLPRHEVRVRIVLWMQGLTRLQRMSVPGNDSFSGDGTRGAGREDGDPGESGFF